MYRTVVIGETGSVGVSMCFLADMDAALLKATRASVDIARQITADVAAEFEQ